MDDNTLLNDRYEIQEILGRGGFATTYLALDTQTQQTCAIKCLSFRKIKEWKTWELFEREANILKNLDHPQIPDYLDFFTIETGQDVEIYLVQEYVEGKSLALLVQEGKHFTEPEAVHIALELTRILEYLHSFSPPIIHRDIKPGNITITAENQVYLIDFGSVRDTIRDDLQQEAPTIVGTYGYMPLEQFEGRAVPASDIYSLGMTLLHILSRRDPGQFEKKGLRPVFRPHVNISDPFARMLDNMIVPNWEDRYQTASQLRNDLERVLAGELPLTRPGILEPQRKPERFFWQKPSFNWMAIVSLLVVLLGIVAGSLYFTWQRQAPLPVQEEEPVVRPEPAPTIETEPEEPETSPAPAEDYTLYTVKGRILFDNQPISIVTTAEPVFSLLNQTSRQHETPEISYGEEGQFTLHGVFAGHFYMSVEMDANLANPPRYPGDFMKWGVEFDVPATDEIVVDMAQVIHLMSPQDNARQMTGGASDDGCSNPTQLRSPVQFVWDSSGEGVTYNYLVGTVDCIEHVYFAGSVVNEYTTSTEISLELPPNKPDEKYSFHIFAEKDGQQIGRLYIHNEGVSNWNYDFQVIGDEAPVSEEQTPQETLTRPIIHGRLFFAGQPITDVTTFEPTFWFRNEDTGKEQSARVKHQSGVFSIYGLPAGNFGVSVNIDANMQNPWSYPGDFRSWQPFSVIEGENPELVVNMLQIIRMTGPQDNNTVMDKWGAECMDKITFQSPVTFRWEPFGAGIFYDYQITRMDCLDSYNSAGTVADGTLSTTEITVDLPPSRDNECYGFHLYARQEEQRIGMLMTHGAYGYGWDYRFRVQ